MLDSFDMRLQCVFSASKGDLALPRSRKAEKHADHAYSHPAYSAAVSDADLRVALHLGYRLCCRALRQLGYASLLQRYPTLLAASTELTTRSKVSAIDAEVKRFQLDALRQSAAQGFPSEQECTQAWCTHMLEAELEPMLAALDAITGPAGVAAMDDTALQPLTGMAACAQLSCKSRGPVLRGSNGRDVSAYEWGRCNLNSNTAAQDWNQLGRFKHTQLQGGLIRCSAASSISFLVG